MRKGKNTEVFGRRKGKNTEVFGRRFLFFYETTLK
jgi:hypothetical protein